MRQYIDILNESALNEYVGGDEPKQIIMAKAKEILSKSKDLSPEELVSALQEAIKRVNAMSPEEIVEIGKREYEKLVGKTDEPLKTDDAQTTDGEVKEQVINEFLGWDDIVFGFVFLCCMAIVMGMPLMAFVELLFLTVEVAIHIPYLILRKIWDGSRFSVHRWIDVRVREILRKHGPGRKPFSFDDY